MNESPIYDLFDSFVDVKALVVGDLMLDHYIFGKMNRISPEGPMPIVDVYKKENRLGGAGNVASNIHYMGATSILVSVIGNDDSGQNILTTMKQNGMNTAGIILDIDRKTTTKNRIFCQNRQVTRFDDERIEPLTPKLEIALLHLIEELIIDNEPQVLVLQDYNKGVLTTKVIEELLLLADKYNIPTAVDPKFRNFTSYKSCTLFKPNLNEISAALQVQIAGTDTDLLAKAAQTVENELGNNYTVITLGEHGIFMKANENINVSSGVKGLKVFDVCGAGDTVIAVLAVGLALGKNMFMFMEIANIAAAQVCQEVGVVNIDLKRLYDEVSGIYIK